MITLGIMLLVLYAISIYKIKEAGWDFYMVDGIWEVIATIGTVLILSTLAITLLILIVKYLP
jgi:hypothetical protein